MFKVIYTKTLENASDIVAESHEYVDKKNAIALFNERVQKLFDEVKDNSLLSAKFSINHYRAFVRIEGTHHCIAIVDDLNDTVAI